ncbi:hypothetical protein T05_16044 [Trichinella murrelli]|uniref:Uncharacterized protein n=1 Tax=Trichinella murrelli TaxID=144512 RepID=A0A0V0SVA9_9BILA|nr:hypothetical protein T05_16044 [Trichinella murrelli]
MAVLMIQKKMRRVHFRLLCSMRSKLLTTGAWGSNYQITATTRRGVRTQSQ